jgi:hypothetical protein
VIGPGIAHLSRISLCDCSSGIAKKWVARFCLHWSFERVGPF